MLRGLPIAFFALVVAPGCTPGEGCEPGDGDPTLELGKGVTEYEPMDAGDGRLEVIHGPQGGYHVEIGFEATYLDASADWTIALTGEAGDASASSTPFVTMQCNRQTGTLQSWGHLLIWDREGPELDGRAATITATATDAAGTEATATADVELFFPEPT